MGYASTIEKTAGLLHYYPMGESSGTAIVDHKGSANGTYSGVTLGESGPLSVEATTAPHFNGTSSSGSIPLNLSANKTLSVEFWLYNDAWADNDELAMEFTANFNSNPDGFILDINSSATAEVSVSMRDEGEYNHVQYKRPTAAAWHHYVVIFDKTKSASEQIAAYVDGASVTLAPEQLTLLSQAFANSTLYLMSRAGSALFLKGKLGQLAIYEVALSSATVKAHFEAATVEVIGGSTSQGVAFGIVVSGRKAAVSTTLTPSAFSTGEKAAKISLGKTVAQGAVKPLTPKGKKVAGKNKTVSKVAVVLGTPVGRKVGIGKPVVGVVVVGGAPVGTKMAQASDTVLVGCRGVAGVGVKETVGSTSTRVAFTQVTKTSSEEVFAGSTVGSVGLLLGVAGAKIAVFAGSGSVAVGSGVRGLKVARGVCSSSVAGVVRVAGGKVGVGLVRVSVGVGAASRGVKGGRGVVVCISGFVSGSVAVKGARGSTSQGLTVRAGGLAGKVAAGRVVVPTGVRGSVAGSKAAVGGSAVSVALVCALAGSTTREVTVLVGFVAGVRGRKASVGRVNVGLGVGGVAEAQKASWGLTSTSVGVAAGVVGVQVIPLEPTHLGVSSRTSATITVVNRKGADLAVGSRPKTGLGVETRL